jgi:hypothetical protein
MHLTIGLERSPSHKHLNQEGGMGNSPPWLQVMMRLRLRPPNTCKPTEA